MHRPSRCLPHPAALARCRSLALRFAAASARAAPTCARYIDASGVKPE